MSPIGSSRPARRAAPKKSPAPRRRAGASLVSRIIRPKQKKIFRPSFIIAIVAVLAVLLIAFVLQRTVQLPPSVGEQVPAPDFTTMLPTGSQASPAGPIALPDESQSSYALGYVTGEGAAVAYFRWSRVDQQYHLTATVPLSGGGGHISGMPVLSTLRIGTGASIAIVAKGTEVGYLSGVYVLTQSGDGLAFVDSVSQDGTAGIAHFLSGSTFLPSSTARHVVSIDFGDVNGDGDQDAVVSTTDTDSAGQTTKTATVYAWTDGQFVYSKDLTWALTADRSVFPEPVAPPKTP